MSTTTTDPEWFKPADIATRRQVTTKVVLNMLRAGRMPGIKAGREWRIPREQYDAWRQGAKVTRSPKVKPTHAGVNF